MLVSIIIPVYNVQDYIVRCLESVADQTYKGAMECLIIDDCGQDDSIKLAEEFIETYQGTINFRIIHHDHNKGLSVARNTGIRAAKGEWLYFLDSDDWIELECIQCLYDCALAHPEAEMVCAGALATSPGYEFLDYRQKDLPVYSADRNWIQMQLLSRFSLGMTSWNKLVLRNFVMTNNLFFKEGLCHEDELWNFRLSQHLKKLAIVHQNIYNYNIRPNSIITTTDEVLVWHRLFALWNVMIDSLTGYRIPKQILGISGFVIDRTKNDYPPSCNYKLFVVFVKLAFRASGIIRFYLLIQAFFALTNSTLYYNTRIRSKLLLR